MSNDRTVLRGTTVVDVRDGSLRGDVDVVVQQAEDGADFIKVALVNPPVFFALQPRRPDSDWQRSAIYRSASTSGRHPTARCARSNTWGPGSA